MPSTLKYGITYPAGSVAPNVPIVMQQQAESVDAAIGKAAGLKHAEYISPTLNSPAGQGVTFGTLSVDAAQTVNNTFSTGSTGGVINITEAGVYLFTSTVLPANGGNPGNVHMWSTSGGTLVASEGQITYGSNFHTICFSFRLLAGSAIALGFTSSNTVDFSARVKITKIQNG